MPDLRPNLTRIGGRDPGQPAFSVSNLNFYYGANQALHKISLTIADRIVTALIGPSGCGKSTFLRTLNRMYEVVSNTRVTGSILLRSEDLLSIELTELRRKVGMVFQSCQPIPKKHFREHRVWTKGAGWSLKSIAG